MTIDLPFLPPSVNQMYPSGANGRRFKSEEYKAFQEAFRWTLIRCDGKSLPFRGNLRVEINFYFDNKRKQDIDNRIKPALDTLKLCGIIEDDSQITVLHVEKYQADKRATLIRIENVF